MICYTYWKGVFSNQELSKYLKEKGELPESEMFQRLTFGDGDLIKESGFIAQEECDEELFKDIPETLKEALG